MSGETLLTHGDEREQEFWPVLQKHFPLYEEFWHLYIFPLRATDGYIRGDIDERLEIMAQEHYKCFVSLHRAALGLDNEVHPEQTFSSLQNAGNRARQVLAQFNNIRAECVPANPDPIDSEPFGDFNRNIARYRNHIHEDLMGMVQYQERRYLPKPDRLDQYLRWSRLRQPDLVDFTLVSDVLHERFELLCTLLDQHWRMMLAKSPEILTSPRYSTFLPSLTQPTQVVMCRMVLSSNVHLG